MFNEETQVSRYEVRRGPGKLWLRRHYGEAGFSDALSPLHAAAGWASNTFWYLQGSELRIDYNAGRAYRTPLDLLRDHRSSAMAPFTLTVMKAMHFGVPTHPGQLQWDGRGFSATNSAHARISGVLVCGSAGPERLVFDRILTSGGQETIVHTRATLRYREPQGLYPVGVRIEHESVSAGRPPSRWEEEFTDVQVAVEPSRPEGSFAPEGFIDAYADSIQVRVRSNQWHYIAFMNGAWLESPIFLEMDRRGVASPRAKSLVRLLF